MSSPYSSQDSFAFGLYEQPDRFDWTQQDGTEVVQERVAADITREDTVETDPFCQQRTQLPAEKLGFCPLSDWDEDNLYDEDPPSYIHYLIEWKVTVNNRMVSKDTEPDVVIEPASYWRLILKPKLEKLLCKKLAKNRPIKSEDTNVVVSVTERSQRDLNKRFDDTDIDWRVVERQLLKWAELFRAGKKLRLNFSFNYVETSQLVVALSRTTDKRGSSATKQMLAQRAEQLGGEQESSGQPSVWRDVYSLMRCPGPPCHLGPHCWRDPIGKKHYKLKTHHLKSLIRYVEQGYELRTHENVPEDIREQLYAEEQQWLERRQKTSSTSAGNFPPINITNVLPPQAYQPPFATSPTRTPPLNILSTSSPVNRLDIPGPRDVAVRDYSHWHQSKVNDEILKVEFQKACDVTLADGLDLEQVHDDQDPDFFIDKGVKRGIARRFVNDIEPWVKRYKRAEITE
ncbi:hypothetical protein LSUE1_G004473 [Lachnellula suecica]|uniref:Uncharacterized protein n=1 Tax=Lachnellula suecica TaxID=602035 RepID=A0A8T9BYQ1_9HELO|nr:hypothetical protein LSUE1_G004473 [Lachnellula suecica]